VYTSLSLFLSPVLPSPWPETGLVEDILVWSSEDITWSKLRVGMVAKFVAASTQARPKGTVLAPCVTLVLLAVHSCIVYEQRYTVPGC